MKDILCVGYQTVDEETEEGFVKYFDSEEQAIAWVNELPDVRDYQKLVKINERL